MPKKKPTTAPNGFLLGATSLATLIGFRISSFYLDVPFLYERGFTQYITVTAFSFIFCFCLIKLVLVLKQRRGMKDLWLSDYVNFEEHDSEDLANFSARLRDRTDLLSHVIRKIIKIYIKTGSRACTLDYFKDEIELRREQVESTFVIVRTACYSLPMLGFLGTVIGISESVGKFTDVLGDTGNIRAIKEAIGGITYGLSTAFDTTLLALILSIIAVVLLSFIENVENGLHNRVEEYCNENLIPRIPDSVAIAKAEPNSSISTLERMKAKNAAKGLSARK